MRAGQAHYSRENASKMKAVGEWRRWEGRLRTRRIGGGYVNNGGNGSLRLKEMGREEWRWSPPEKKDSGQGRFIENEGVQHTLYLYAE